MLQARTMQPKDNTSAPMHVGGGRAPCPKSFFFLSASVAHVVDVRVVCSAKGCGYVVTFRPVRVCFEVHDKGVMTAPSVPPANSPPRAGRLACFFRHARLSHITIHSRRLHGGTDDRFDNRVGRRGSAAGSNLPQQPATVVPLQRDLLRDIRRCSGGGGRAGGRNREKAGRR